MKAPKLFLASVALSVSLAAFSQQETQKTQKSEAEKKESKTSTWGIYPPAVQPTESAAAAAEAQGRAIQQSFPAPNFGTYYIPVLGDYTSSASVNEKKITITADEKNVGKVWIEGLAPVKVYALLKASPATYKIPAQKQVQEGTLNYDESTKQVNVCLGCGYKDKNPAAVLEMNSTAKSKRKSVLRFTGVKTDQGRVINQ